MPTSQARHRTELPHDLYAAIEKLQLTQLRHYYGEPTTSQKIAVLLWAALKNLGADAPRQPWSPAYGPYWVHHGMLDRVRDAIRGNPEKAATAAATRQEDHDGTR